MRRLLLSLVLLTLSLAACGPEEPAAGPDEPLIIPTVDGPPQTGQPPTVAAAPTATVGLPAPEATAAITTTVEATPEPTAVATTAWRSDVAPLPVGYRPVNDLLFLSNGHLRLWSAADGAVTTLLGPPTGLDSRLGAVVDFHTSADGRRVAAVRQTGIEPNRFELLALTIGDPAPQVIARNLLEVRAFQVSPDGGWIAYVPGIDADADTLARLAPLTIFLAPGGGGASRPFAECTQAPPTTAHPEGRGLYSTLCGHLIWTVDGQHLFWRDGDGLRTRALIGNVSYARLAHDFSPPTENGPLIYDPVSWSPGARYLLLNVLRWEHSTQAVFDPVTGRLLPIPHVLSGFGPPQAHVTWMADDRLFLVRQDDVSGRVAAEIYRLPTEGSALVLDEQQVLGENGSYALGPHHHADGRFGLTLWATGEALGTTALLTLGSLAHPQPWRLALPAQPLIGFQPTWVAWSAGGELALIPQTAPETTRVRALLADVPAERAYDASDVLGLSLAKAVWLP